MLDEPPADGDVERLIRERKIERARVDEAHAGAGRRPPRLVEHRPGAVDGDDLSTVRAYDGKQAACSTRHVQHPRAGAGAPESFLEHSKLEPVRNAARPRFREAAPVVRRRLGIFIVRSDRVHAG